MLEEYKKIYTESASRISNWKKLSRDDLAFKYIENEDNDLAESYLSALILSFWNVIVHNFNTKTYNSVTEDDAYNWVILGILEALQERCWEKPDNSLYLDPKGPEKAINVKCFQNKCRYYQVLEMNKRRIDKSLSSLDELEEETSEAYFLPISDDSEHSERLLFRYLKTFFDKKEYLKFFILDAIVNVNLLINNQIDEFQLRKHIRTIDKKYCTIISSLYDIPVTELLTASNLFKSLCTNTLSSRIERIIKDMTRDKKFKAFLLNEEDIC